MSARAEVAIAATVRKLSQRAYSLGAANGFDYAVQMLMPVVLVRCLESEAFGQFRLFWLIVGTVTAFANMAMPASLFYFLPRSDGAMQRLYINQTVIFLAVVGVLCGLSAELLDSIVAAEPSKLGTGSDLLPMFLCLWIVASLVDVLPMADERAHWQSKLIAGLATTRAVLLSAVAITTRDLGAVYAALLAFAWLKVGTQFVYIANYHGLRRPLLRHRAFVDQLQYAAPFGFAGALYMLRLQADQWIAATLFSVTSFASLSIAAAVAPVVHVFRSAVSAAFLPSLSRSHAGGDTKTAAELNARANAIVGKFVYPALAFAFVFAGDLVTFVYTSTYIEAAVVMRIYLLGLAVLVVELATMALILSQGRFILGLNLLGLLASVSLSWFAAQRIGLPGAATGSVTVAVIDRIVTVLRISRLTGISIARLQHWKLLATQLGLASAAATVAWLATTAALEADSAPLRLLLGGGLHACCYAALYHTVMAGFFNGADRSGRNP